MAAPARAQVTMNSLRIGAVNTEALAKFYQAAFGMQEVNRIAVAGGPENLPQFRRHGGRRESEPRSAARPHAP